jgi:hypothetical protein
MGEVTRPPAAKPVPLSGVRRPRIVGPVAPPVYTAGAKAGAIRIASEGAEPLVTEGMKARQREIDKKRRVVASLRQVEEEEAAERWARGRAWIVRLVAVLIAFGVYLKMQSMYGDRWPMLAVWVFLAVMLGVAVTWLLWYLDYSG